MVINKEVRTSIEQDIQDRNVQIFNNEHSSDLLKAMEFLHSQKNIEGNTILTNNQVIALTLINWASQVYDISFFKHFVSMFPKYRISGDDGRGRKELIEIANAIQREKQAEQEKYLELLGRK
jgi:hypothetical protein